MGRETGAGVRVVRAAAVFLLLGAAACAGSTGAEAPAPVPFDPVGTWIGQTSAQGQSVAVTIEISGEPGRWSGLLRASADVPEVPLSEVSVEGRTVTARGQLMGEALVVILTAEGSDFTGSWSAMGMSGTLVGTRR